MIKDLQSSMLYFENIERFSKDIFLNEELKENKKKYNKNSNTDMKIKTDDLTIVPNYKDKLFWIYYILNKGLSSYTLVLGNNFKEENKEKIKLVEKVRNNKEFLK